MELLGGTIRLRPPITFPGELLLTCTSSSFLALNNLLYYVFVFVKLKLVRLIESLASI